MIFNNFTLYFYIISYFARKSIVELKHICKIMEIVVIARVLLHIPAKQPQGGITSDSFFSNTLERRNCRNWLFSEWHYHANVFPSVSPQPILKALSSALNIDEAATGSAQNHMQHLSRGGANSGEYNQRAEMEKKEWVRPRASEHSVSL